MGRPESCCRHRPDCCVREPIRRERDVAKDRGEAGNPGRVSRRNGLDQSERGKGLRAIDTTGEAARFKGKKQKRAGPAEELTTNPTRLMPVALTHPRPSDDAQPDDPLERAASARATLEPKHT